MKTIEIISSGPLDIAGWSNLNCFVAREGKQTYRLIVVSAFHEIVGFEGSQKQIQKSMEAFLANPHLSSKRFDDLRRTISNPIRISHEGNYLLCYDHRVITQFARAVLEARRYQAITGERFLAYADSCERFLAASADVGLASLIDEATGYDQFKKKDEYRSLFLEYIREEFREWEKEFPEIFFDGIYKIYGITKIPNKNHPQFFAKFIRKYIYHPLADSNGTILQYLDGKNPVISDTEGRKHKLHQFLSDNVGVKALRAQIWQIVGIMNSVKTKSGFQKAFKNAFPQAFDQMEFDLDDI